MHRHRRFDASASAAEDAREQEFYSYYEPLVQQSGAIGGTRTAPTDSSLTAFCQLGCLRLNARRAVISFFDRHNQYVLAESTRTFSFPTGTIQDEADTLWLGPCTIPRGNSVCEFTADPSMAWDLVDHREGPPVRVISDLAQHEQFKRKDFVLKKPFLRFYAGVPIVTSTGTAIGAYCVLDEEPREDLLPWEVSLLKDMSITVMAHLEMVRANAENQRSQHMIRGLSSFMHGSASLKDWAGDRGSQLRTRRKPSIGFPSSPHVNNSITHTTSLYPSGQADVATPTWSRRGSEPRSETPTSPRTSFYDRPLSSSISTEEGVKSWKQRLMDQDGTADTPRSSRSSIAGSTTFQEELLSSNLRSMFGRAATNLQEAVDVDGAVFLDASVGYFGGLVISDTDHRDHHIDSLRGMHHMSDPGEPGLPTSDFVAHKEKDAIVLGVSHSERQSSPAYHYGHQDQCLSEQFLQALLKRYPRGKTWRFSSEADTFNPEEMSTPIEGLGDGEQNNPCAPSITSMRPPDKVNRKGWRIKERETLQQVFPGVRYLALVGLWDSHRNRYFAGSVIWTCSPLRIFSSKHEVPYLAAFADSIMAEVARLDFRMAEQAKTDVLSSISHELRSPLHGILGCTECLQDTALDAFQQSLVRTTETCGKTLLDAVDHLLEHAKIKRTPPSLDNWQDDAAAENIEVPTSDYVDALRSGSSPVEDQVDLSLVIEQALESSFAGHDHEYTRRRRRELQPGKTDHGVRLGTNGLGLFGKEGSLPPTNVDDNGQDIVRVILDLHQAADSHWIFRTDAGVWNRLVLNLVNNSLKFTKNGYVRIHLKTAPMQGLANDGLYQVELTITDSGIGISPQFMQSRLFSPFSQEDPLSSGTGLGLSIVKGIVDKLGGHIAVDSAKNEGTEIKITVPSLTKSGLGRSTLEQDELLHEIKQRSDLQLNFIGMNEDKTMPFSEGPRNPHNAEYLFKESFVALCRDWYGLSPIWSKEPAETDIYVTTAAAARRISAKSSLSATGDQRRTFARPLIVICDDSSMARSLSETGSSAALSACTEYIAQPCGPRKLMKAFALCSERINAPKGGQEEIKSLMVTEPESRREWSSRLSLAHGISSRLDLTTKQTLVDEAVEERDFETNSSKQDDSSKETLERESGGACELVFRPRMDRVDTSMAGQAIPPSSYCTEEVSATAGAEGSRDRVEKPQTASLLLVDDNPINLQLLVMYAKKNKHPYATATNGLEALEVYKNSLARSKIPSLPPPTIRNRSQNTPVQPFDFLFMDISMPIMDGLEATRQIRAFERAAGVRPANIIALTALVSVSVQQEAYSSGVDMFCSKPVRLKQLTEILKTDGKSRKSVSS